MSPSGPPALQVAIDESIVTTKAALPLILKKTLSLNGVPPRLMQDGIYNVFNPDKLEKLLGPVVYTKGKIAVTNAEFENDNLSTTVAAG